MKGYLTYRTFNQCLYLTPSFLPAIINWLDINYKFIPINWFHQISINPYLLPIGNALNNFHSHYLQTLVCD